MNDNVAREVGPDTRDKCSRPELSKGVVTPVGGNDVVTRLSAAVITHDNVGSQMTNEEIRQQAFAGIPETQVNDDIGAQGTKIAKKCAALSRESSTSFFDCRARRTCLSF